jgi:5-formyltetrahydrofolate cyclo-ligase
VCGILEPAPEANSVVIIPDLKIVPGVAFDRQMNRLGRGKGYYDRLFSAVEWNAVKKIGLCFHFQIVPAVPVQETDIRMHCVVTDKGVLGLCFVNE